MRFRKTIVAVTGLVAALTIALDAATTEFRDRNEWLAAVGLTTPLTTVDFEELPITTSSGLSQITSKGVVFRMVGGTTPGNGLFIRPAAAPGYGGTTGNYLLGANDNFYLGNVEVTLPANVTGISFDLWRYCPSCPGIDVVARVSQLSGSIYAHAVKTQDNRAFLGITSTLPISYFRLTATSYVVIDNLAFTQELPNLSVTNVSVAEAAVLSSGTITVSDTVKNTSTKAAASGSTTRYYLDKTTSFTASSILLDGSRFVPALEPDASNSGSVSVKVFPSTPAGDYYVLACADDQRNVAESDETGNCRATTTTLRVNACPQLEKLSERIGAAGGKRELRVLDGACTWSAFPVQSWVKITSGAAGTGPGTIVYTVSPNLYEVERSVEIVVGGSIFTLTQDAGSIRILDPNPALLEDDGSRVTVKNAPAAVAVLGAEHQRTGIATDGVSKLLIAVKSAQPLSFAVTSGAGADGTFRCLDGTTGSCAPAAVGGIEPDLVVAVYTPPVDMGDAGARTVTVRVCDPGFCSGTSRRDISIDLVDAPIILIHGLNSNDSIWDKWKASLRLQNLRVDSVNYGPISTDTISDMVAARFEQVVARNLIHKARQDSIAVSRVDVVAHSMGGVVTRLLATDSSFFAKDNYRAGLVRRLVTMGTPHLGSSLASVLKGTTGPLPPTLSAALRPLVRSFFGVREVSAVTDLAPGSALLNALPRNVIPTHPIAAQWIPSQVTAASLMNKVAQIFGYASVDFAFGLQANDLVVEIASQLDGASAPSVIGSACEAVSASPGSTTLFQSGVHFAAPHVSGSTIAWCAEPEALGVQQRAMQLLRGSISNFNTVVSDGEQSRQRVQPAVIAPREAADSGDLRLTSPAPGTAVKLTPGTALTITATPATGVSPKNLLFVVDGLGLISGPEAPPYTVTLPLPPETPLGRVEISVLATDSAGAVLADSVAITVAPDGPPTSLEVQPNPIRLGPTVPVTDVRVHATFGTGATTVVQDVTDLSTFAVTSGTSVSVSNRGVVIAVGTGNSVIEVSYGGLKAQVPATSEGSASCSYTTTALTPLTFGLAGGTGKIGITTESGCSWRAVPADSFIAITGADAGTGSGTVSFTVAPAATPRTGLIGVAGKSVTIEQTSSCVVSVSVDEVVMSALGGSGVIDVTTSEGCTWTATATDAWLSLTPASGTGAGQISYTVQPFSGASERTATIALATATVRFRQRPVVSGLPAAPTQLTASVTNRVVKLDWQAGTTGGTPTGFVIEAGSAPGLIDIAALGINATLTWSYSGVPDGIYFVRVRASNAQGFGPASNEVTITVGAGAPPAAPKELTGSIANGVLTLNWKGGAGGGPIDAHTVEGGSAFGMSNLGRVATGSGTSFQYQPIPPGRYFIRVTASNARGQSRASNELELIYGLPNLPGAPNGLTATLNGSSLRLAWLPASSGPAATTYLIEAGTQPGLSDVAVIGTGSTEPTWSYNGVPPGQVFYLRLRASNAAGWSLASNEVTIGQAADAMPSVETVSTPPPPLAQVSRGLVHLSWNLPASSSRYLVEISRDGRGAAYRIEVASGESSVDVIGLEPGVYVASVSALSYGSESARSAPVLFTVPTP